MDFVSWDDEIPNIWKVLKFQMESHNPFHGSSIDYYIPLYPIKNPNDIGSSHHQPEIKLAKPPSGTILQKNVNHAADEYCEFHDGAAYPDGPWPILQAAKAGMRSQSSTSSTSHTFEDSQVLCYKNPPKTSQRSMLSQEFV